MVDPKARYDTLILLPRARAFHFNGPPPVDILSLKYLKSNDFDEIVSAVLAHVQQGDFKKFTQLTNVMKKTDDGVVWGRCCELFAYAAPFSAIHELLDAFHDELYDSNDVVTQQWICELLCMSGALWCVPDVLKIFRLNKQRDRYFSVPRYLSFLLEDERAEISFGPPVLPRTDDLPRWFDVPIIYNDDDYEQLVMDRYAVLCAKSNDPSRACVTLANRYHSRRPSPDRLRRQRIWPTPSDVPRSRPSNRLQPRPHHSPRSLLVFNSGDPLRPIIVGRIAKPQKPPLMETTLPSLPRSANIDGERITIEGRDEIVLQCGKASITLRRNGKVIIRGTRLESHATGANRVKGASVQIN